MNISQNILFNCSCAVCLLQSLWDLAIAFTEKSESFLPHTLYKLQWSFSKTAAKKSIPYSSVDSATDFKHISDIANMWHICLYQHKGTCRLTLALFPDNINANLWKSANMEKPPALQEEWKKKSQSEITGASVLHTSGPVHQRLLNNSCTHHLWLHSSIPSLVPYIQKSQFSKVVTESNSTMDPCDAPAMQLAN